MQEKERCSVEGCNGFIVLCPEFCASHWWELTRAQRHGINSARARGMRDGIHPSPLYRDRIKSALQYLYLHKGEYMEYEALPGDRGTGHSRATFCAHCKGVAVHHGVIRALKAHLVCSECQNMVLSVLDGAEPLPGIDA